MCFIGITEEERSTKQKLVISAEIWPEKFGASQSDSIADVISYSHIKKLILRIAENSHCCLLETLGFLMLRELFSLVQIKKASVEISKPDIWDNGVPSVTLSLSKKAGSLIAS